MPAVLKNKLSLKSNGSRKWLLPLVKPNHGIDSEVVSRRADKPKQKVLMAIPAEEMTIY